MTQPLQAKIHDSLGPSSARIRILLINPNSTIAFTRDLITYLATTLPGDVRVDFYTAPSTAPPSIDGTEDGKKSTAAIVQDLSLDYETASITPSGSGEETTKEGATTSETAQWLIANYSSVIVACFSMHPLVTVLRQALAGKKERVPIVLGIMESAILAAMNLGGRFGIATTGEQWEPLFDAAIPQLGIQPHRYAGTKGTGFDAISLHGNAASDALLAASVSLVKDEGKGEGADVIVLGCGGMAPMRGALEDALCAQVGRRIPIVDGVQTAVDMGIGYACMGISNTF